MSSSPYSIDNGVVGTVVVIISALLMILAIMWFIFPFIVNYKMQLLIDESKKQTELLEQIERNGRQVSTPGTAALPKSSFDIKEPPSRFGLVLFLCGIPVVVIVILALIRLRS